MLESKDDFPDVNPDLLLCEAFPLVQVSKQLPSTHIICKTEQDGTI